MRKRVINHGVLPQESRLHRPSDDPFLVVRGHLATPSSEPLRLDRDMADSLCSHAVVPCDRLRKRSSFSLIEVMIALSLLALLLGSLFFWIRHISVEKRGYSQIHAQVHEERACHIRLSRIIPATASSLSSDGKSLHFTFNQGMDPDPLFSGKVSGSITYDDSEKILLLRTTPENSHEPIRKFTLLKNVSSLSFRFYFAPLDHKKVDPDAVGDNIPKKGWQPTWFTDFKMLPKMVEITLGRNGREVVFTYMIEAENKEINYLK